MRTIAFCALPLLLCACQAITTGQATADPQVGGLVAGSPEWRGLKFARNRCADCHVVEVGQKSATGAAPSFAAVSNTPGATKASLNSWLGSYARHPREMYFEIPAEHIDDLVAYLLTLRGDRVGAPSSKLPVR